jgi:beta-carotene hydroxylase
MCIAPRGASSWRGDTASAPSALGKIKPERDWLGAPVGTLVNPTVGLLVGALAALAAGTGAYVTEAWPLWSIVGLHAVALYVIFTPLHESMHGIAHADPARNLWIGRIAGACLTISRPMFRAVHYEHHSHTNDPARDPDFIVARAPRWLLPLWCAAIVVEYRRKFYGHRLWRSPAGRREAVAYDVALAALLAIAVVTGHGPAVLVLWVIPALLALLMLAFLFDFLPHYPYDTRQTYLDTRVYGGSIANVLLLGQNQHLIHHLWTTIPWFRYRTVFRQIEPELRVRQSRIGWRVRPLPAAGGAQHG